MLLIQYILRKVPQEETCFSSVHVFKSLLRPNAQTSRVETLLKMFLMQCTLGKFGLQNTPGGGGGGGKGVLAGGVSRLPIFASQALFTKRGGGGRPFQL